MVPGQHSEGDDDGQGGQQVGGGVPAPRGHGDDRLLDREGVHVDPVGGVAHPCWEVQVAPAGADPQGQVGECRHRHRRPVEYQERRNGHHPGDGAPGQEVAPQVGARPQQEPHRQENEVIPQEPGGAHERPLRHPEGEHPEARHGRTEDHPATQEPEHAQEGDGQVADRLVGEGPQRPVHDPLGRVRPEHAGQLPLDQGSHQRVGREEPPRLPIGEEPGQRRGDPSPDDHGQHRSGGEAGHDPREPAQRERPR